MKMTWIWFPQGIPYPIAASPHVCESFTREPYGNLTDVSPVVSAMRQLAADDPQAASRVDLVFAGRRTPEQDTVLGQLAATPIRCEFTITCLTKSHSIWRLPPTPCCCCSLTNRVLSVWCPPNYSST